MQTTDPARWLSGVQIPAGGRLTVPAPYGATELAGNLTVQSDSPGFVVGWSGAGSRPDASSVQLTAGIVDNYCRMKAAPDGTYAFEYENGTGAPVTVWFDIEAWRLPA